MEEIVRILKEFESLGLDGRATIKEKHYRALAAEITKSINHLPEYEDLNDHLEKDGFYQKNQNFRTAYELGARNAYYFMQEEKHKNECL
tara:strand:- start:5047 stop:5313 length:267 start_codon:yes stop_codon:yes gene_type:complete